MLGREICSDVAGIVVHVKTDATVQTNDSCARFVALPKEVRKDVFSNCVLDIAQWLLADDECADVAALVITTGVSAAALVNGLDDERGKRTKMILSKRWLKRKFMLKETEWE